MGGVSNAFNYLHMALKKSDKNDFPAKPTIGIKYSEFDDGLSIEDKEDNANIGGSSTLIGFDRVSAYTNPTFTDSARWKEGLEHILYGLLPSQIKGTEINENEKDKDGKVIPYRNNGLYRYELHNSGTYEDLPHFTLIKGFNMWEKDDVSDPKNVKPAVKPEILDNAQVGDLEINLSNEDTVTISPTFSSDAPLSGVAEPPSLSYLAKSSKITRGMVGILIGNVGEGLGTLTRAICVKEMSISLSNNLENSSCVGDVFGRNSADSTNFTGELSITFELSRAAMNMRRSFLTGSVDKHYVTEEMKNYQIAIEINGPCVTKFVEETQEYKMTGQEYKMLIRFPKIYITSVKPSQSGSEGATLEVEAKILPSTIFDKEKTPSGTKGHPVEVTLETDIKEIDEATEYYTELPPKPYTYCEKQI